MLEQSTVMEQMYVYGHGISDLNDLCGMLVMIVCVCVCVCASVYMYVCMCIHECMCIGVPPSMYSCCLYIFLH